MMLRSSPLSTSRRSIPLSVLRRPILPIVAYGQALTNSVENVGAGHALLRAERVGRRRMIRIVSVARLFGATLPRDMLVD